jgi:hypothetical protein
MANPITALADVRRRLSKLKPAQPWVDCSPWAIPHLLAVIEGRPYSILPAPERELSPKAKEASEQAFRLRMKGLDSIAARLETADPGGAARFQADIERKRAANIRALEREAKAREGA